MRSLYESLLDDEDELVDNADNMVLMSAFMKTLKNDNPFYKDRISNNGYEVIIDGNADIIVTIPIPEYVSFKCGPNITIRVCSELKNMKSIKNVNRIWLGAKSIIENFYNINSKYIELEYCDSNHLKIFDYLHNLEYLFITRCNNSIKKLDLKNKYVRNIKISNSECIEEIKNCNCESIFLDYCPKLKIINNVDCKECIEIRGCKSLIEFTGNNNFKSIHLDSSCKKLKPESLPQSVKRIFGASSFGKEWLPSNIKTLLPSVNLSVSSLPDASKFKALDDTNYKEGAWIVVRGASKFHGAYGSSRGDLSVDKIKKINKTTGNITTEYNGSRKSTDFEIMKDANPNKDWTYKDPQGLNDITGVGIEVGDEVVSYAASGSFGKNNGIFLDKVIAITKARVRCEKTGLRTPEDICILRSQEICDKQLKKG